MLSVLRTAGRGRGLATPLSHLFSTAPDKDREQKPGLLSREALAVPDDFNKWLMVPPVSRPLNLRCFTEAHGIHRDFSPAEGPSLGGIRHAYSACPGPVALVSSQSIHRPLASCYLLTHPAHSLPFCTTCRSLSLPFAPIHTLHTQTGDGDAAEHRLLLQLEHHERPAHSNDRRRRPRL